MTTTTAPKKLGRPKKNPEANGAGAPEVAKAAPPKVNRASNLFQGLMRGGLMKIVDNKQLLDSAKLGSGGLTKGDSKSVAGALASRRRSASDFVRFRRISPAGCSSSWRRG